MSGHLVVEVLDHAPADLAPADRLVLVAIAEWAARESRRCWRSNDDIRARVGISASGLRAAYARLAKHGLDPRVPAGQNPDGSLRYAWKGHATQFRLPPLPPPAGCRCRECRHSSGATVVALRRHSSGAQPS